MAKLRTSLCERLGIRLPILQAPMAGGATTPALVTAASGAGALGSFGFAYTQPEAMQRDCATVREHTGAPFGVNLFASAQPAAVEPQSQGGAIDAIAGYYAEVGLPPPQPVKTPYAPDLEAQLAAVEDIRPPVFTFHLGDLPASRVKHLQSLGIIVGGSATCIAEARRLESGGVDFIIAQGAEAGGHRGTYLRNPYDAMTGTFALTRLIVRSVQVPVVAAGGIMDGAGIAAALALGAQAAQLGTAFIPCTESGLPPVYKQAILAAQEDETWITEKFSGKPARGIANRFMREMSAKDAPQLAFPAQNALTGPLRAAAAKAGRTDFIALWAGQAVPLAREMAAGQFIAQLAAETEEALSRLEVLFR